jgi:hypothetical protein
MYIPFRLGYAISLHRLIIHKSRLCNHFHYDIFLSTIVYRYIISIDYRISSIVYIYISVYKISSIVDRYIYGLIDKWNGGIDANNQALSELGFYLVARRSGSWLNQLGNLILGKVMKSASVI